MRLIDTGDDYDDWACDNDDDDDFSDDGLVALLDSHDNRTEVVRRRSETKRRVLR